MTALSDLKIKEDLERNEIFIHPYDPQNLGSASYDVRLGRYFFEAGRPHTSAMNSTTSTLKQIRLRCGGITRLPNLHTSTNVGTSMPTGLTYMTMTR